MAYDGGYEPPDWWFTRYEKAVDQLGWKNPRIIEEASRIDPRKKWGPDRLVKMWKERRGTVALVAAVSAALDIPCPIVEAQDEAEAEAMKAWLTSRRRKGLPSDAEAKRAAVLQVLDSTVAAVKGQTPPLSSGHEGEAHGRGTGRAARRR